MSDTHHIKLKTKHYVRGRANVYGLCPCSQCRYGRSKFKAEIDSIKRRIRRLGKLGKDIIIKGIYTD